MQIIVAEAGSGEAGGAAAPFDLNLALHVGPPVLTFFETPIFLPNKISRKSNNRPRVCFGFFRAATLVKVSNLRIAFLCETIHLCDINQRLS